MAHKIGTALLSEKVVELCGLSGGQPVTQAKYSKVVEEEKKLPEDTHEKCFQSLTEYDVDDIRPSDLRKPYLFVDTLDSDAVIIDCREKHKFQAWHVPGATNIPYDNFLKETPRLDKRTKYILYCTYGSQTPFLAEILQSKGLEAYAFSGGVPKIKKTLQDRTDSV